MTLLETVQSALERWPAPRERGGNVLVPTHCLYSSNAVVNVLVEGGREAFYAHDDAGAIQAFEAAGGYLENAPRLISGVVKRYGLKIVQGGKIITPRLSLEELPGAIALVANAARAAEAHLLDRWHPVVLRKFKEVVWELLESEFPQRIAKDRLFIGSSNKPHKFDFVVDLGHERHLVLDAVVPEPSAISTSVVRHLDIKQNHGPNIVQRILYDDRQPWQAADLNVLGMGATVVPFSAAPEVLERLAA